jgi:hypothetical protein
MRIAESSRAGFALGALCWHAKVSVKRKLRRCDCRYVKKVFDEACEFTREFFDSKESQAFVGTKTHLINAARAKKICVPLIAKIRAQFSWDEF